MSYRLKSRARDKIAFHIKSVKSTFGTDFGSPAQLVSQLRGGQPFPAPMRASLESHFGHNFSQVHIHTDARAAEAADALNARAFTTGQNIVFGKNQFAPGTRAGKKLLAHELTHVVQQARGAPPAIMRQKANPPQPRLGCTSTQTSMINNARQAAALRTSVALAMIRGWQPPAIPALVTPNAMRARATHLASIIFGVSNPNMSQIEQTVVSIYRFLSNASLQIHCAAVNDPNCRMWEAYVGHQPPIYLCPSLLQSQEQVTRRLIHEAAHLAGVAQSGRESYGMFLDCASSFGGTNVADSWEHYIHCLSGQAPDQPDIITVPRPTARPGGGSATP